MTEKQVDKLIVSFHIGIFSLVLTISVGLMIVNWHLSGIKYAIRSISCH